MISMTESEEGSPRQEISELKDFYRTKEPEQKKSIKRALTETEEKAYRKLRNLRIRFK